MRPTNRFTLFFRSALMLVFLLLASACTTMPESNACTECVPENAVKDHAIARLYESRTWMPPSKLKIDTDALGKESRIPINDAEAKLLGPTEEAALHSLAAKIWMIENARHTLDLSYYIFAPDLAGYSILGALCNAVKRGVDVRLVVDSIGSYDMTHNYLRGLAVCSADAGYITNAKGQPTVYRARAQVVIFNALTNLEASYNRRSHDKLIVKDGHFPELAYVMTGGRNISVDYYGISDDGSVNEDTYKDMEIMLRPDHIKHGMERNIGSVSEVYHSLLFLHDGNKYLSAHIDREDKDDFESAYSIYLDEQAKAQKRLAELRNSPVFAKAYADMPQFMSTNFRKAKVRLAHEMENLTSTDVVTEREKNLRNNPNSIVGLLQQIGRESKGKIKTLKLVSPYFFIPKYYDEDGNETFDGVKAVLAWLDEDPERKIELITNSAMTSDNFMAQAIIDMDTVPRLLLTPEQQEIWQKDIDGSELNPEFIQSEAWQRAINNSRIKVYQTGKLDSVMFKNGTRHYGKLHAKFVDTDAVGFVGTTNLDYRSRLYNNEMGFFFTGDQLLQDLDHIFENLKKDTYLWGSPEWLEMRKQLRALDTRKGKWSRKQHSVFTRLRRWGLEWLI